MQDVFDIYTIIFLALAVFIFLRLRSVLGWVPQTSLERGIEITYRWIREQLEARGEVSG